MKNLKLTAIATLAIASIAHPAQAETLGQFGDRVARTTKAMMENNRHAGAARTWERSDFYQLTGDAQFLKKALKSADRQCDRYAAKKLSWTPAAYNQYTSQIIGDTTKGLPTFAPTPAQIDDIQMTFLAIAVSYEAEKAMCPSIVWRSR